MAGPGRLVDQGRHDPPGLLDVVLAGEAGAVADHRGVQEHLVGRRPLAALLGELHVEVDLLRRGVVAALGVDQQPDPGGRVELDHELVGLRGWQGSSRTPRRGGSLKISRSSHWVDREQLAGADEERDAGPAPVVDLEAHRRERLGGRALRHPLDLPVALVLPADVLRRVGLRASPQKTANIASFSDRASRPAGCSIAQARNHLHQVVDDDVADARRPGRRSCRDPRRRSPRPS